MGEWLFWWLLVKNKFTPEEKARPRRHRRSPKTKYFARGPEAIKTASEKLNETSQAVSTELYKAAADKTRAGKSPGGGQSGNQPGADHNHDDSKKDEEPVIDAEVVDEHQPA